MTSATVYDTFSQHRPFLFDESFDNPLTGTYRFIAEGTYGDSESAPRRDMRRSNYSIIRTFRSSKTVTELGSRTAQNSEAKPVYVSALSSSSNIDEARRVLRGFETVPAGWDGPESRKPRNGVVQDALEVLQNWTADLDIPEPVLAFDGCVALELYDDEGYTYGGIEFHGEHQAVFTVLSRSDLIASGTFDAGSPGDILRTISKIRRALSSK